MRALGCEAKGYRADVLDKKSLEQVREQLHADFGKCDILINGAGGNNPRATTDNEYSAEATDGMKDFFALDPDGVRFVFDLNFIGTFLPTQVFAQDMAGRKGCTILNVSSMNAFRPLTKIPAYSGAKAAVSNFTQWLAVHFAKEGIRVNAVAPGFFVTNQNRGLLLMRMAPQRHAPVRFWPPHPWGALGKFRRSWAPLSCFSPRRMQALSPVW